MAGNFRVEKLFATPLLVTRVEEPELNQQLGDIILKRRADDPGVKRSNTGGGWHSDLQLMDWGGLPARRLRNAVLQIVNANTVDVNGNPPGAWHVEAWANVNENGGANSRHVHGGCYWSAVYYVRTDDPGKGGHLVLHDPRMPTLAMHAPYLRFRDTGGEREIKIKPEPGRLIVFPSWLGHEVEPYMGEGVRISIAINLTASRGAPRGTLKHAAEGSKALPQSRTKKEAQ